MILNSSLLLKVLLIAGGIIGTGYISAYMVRGAKALKQRNFEKKLIKQGLESEEDCSFVFDKLCN